MRFHIRLTIVLIVAAGACFAAADGSWLKKVPQADRVRVNPYSGSAEAATAGAEVFHSNCAKCHGDSAQGKGARPSLTSERIKNATDGDLAWLLKNGNPYKGMPGWGGLPQQERWQIIAYLRTLNGPQAGVKK
jgi:mono/diheme cytochrome c family protein